MYDISNLTKWEIYRHLSDLLIKPLKSKNKGRADSRLAHKSSSKSAKRDRATLPRSAIVGARASEHVARASERELDLFPLLEIESSDVILARTFQGAKLSQGTQAVKITFRVSYNGFKAALVLRWPTKTFSFVFHQFQKIHVFAYIKCGGSVENAVLRWRLFSGSTKTKICQNLELLLGDYFAQVFPDISVLCFFNPYAIASFNGRIISTSNLEVLGPAKTEIQTIARMFENRFPVSSSRAIRQLSPLLAWSGYDLSWLTCAFISLLLIG